ncbi:MAG: pyruvate kinase [Dehalococcoidia bacterium]|nr:pyruvate kinase [Dehalococcoidia bacterium]
MRKTKIVATLGPATATEQGITHLIEAGVDVFRLNFSHGTHESHAQAIQIVRQQAKRLKKPVAILQDLQGPRIRTGAPDGDKPVRLIPGKRVTVAGADEPSTEERITIDFPQLAQVAHAGNRILIADGVIELRVESKHNGVLLAKVVRGGVLDGRKGVNLPEVKLPIPSFTDKDHKDLEFGVAQGVDYIALSFVREADDLVKVQRVLKGMKRSTPLVSKIEKAEAIEALEGIVSASGGVMVARGDLGVELSPERVPMLQKRIIRTANEAEVPVITATQMLESMIHSPWPTRAEASDVANAILDGTDAIMLSGETAVGEYPVQAVETMNNIALEVERADIQRQRAPAAANSHTHSLSRAAVGLAEELRADALVVYTRSGYSAQRLSKERPQVPIFAFTSEEMVYRRLALWYGVLPIMGPFVENTDAMIQQMEQQLVSRGLVKRGATIVIVRLSPPAAQHHSNFVTVRTIPRFSHASK